MDEINKFRQAFFDNVIAVETQKQQEEKLLKANCFHLYNIIGDSYDNRKITYQHRTCSKCGHSAIKRREAWEGSKGCVIQ